MTIVTEAPIALQVRTLSALTSLFHDVVCVDPYTAALAQHRLSVSDEHLGQSGLSGNVLQVGLSSKLWNLVRAKGSGIQLS